MIGSKFYVFGGQVNGEFLNDLWSFDLGSCTFYYIYTLLHLTFMCLIVRTKATWELVEPNLGPKPSERTGHVIVAHGDKILVYCFVFTVFGNRSDHYYPDLAGQTPITTTTIPGHLIPSQNHGQNYNVSASFRPPEKVILLP